MITEEIFLKASEEVANTSPERADEMMFEFSNNQPALFSLIMEYVHECGKEHSEEVMYDAYVIYECFRETYRSMRPILDKELNSLLKKVEDMFNIGEETIETINNDRWMSDKFDAHPDIAECMQKHRCLSINILTPRLLMLEDKKRTKKNMAYTMMEFIVLFTMVYALDKAANTSPLQIVKNLQ